MLVAAVGVVYGDIGTSPLYTLKEVFSGHYGVQANHDGVLGILSLVFWSLIWVVSAAELGSDSRVRGLPIVDCQRHFTETLVCLRAQSSRRILTTFLDMVREGLDG